MTNETNDILQGFDSLDALSHYTYLIDSISDYYNGNIPQSISQELDTKKLDFDASTISPLFTDSCNDYIFENCCGVLYTIVENKLVTSILQNGIKCLGGYDGCVTLFTIDGMHNVKDRIKKHLKRSYLNPNDVSVLKININNHKNIKIFKKVNSEMDNEYITFMRIFPGSVSKVNLQ